MKILAIVVADLEKDFFGAPGHVAEDFLGEPVLKRTVKRVAGLKGVFRTCVICPHPQVDSCKVLLGDMDIEVVGCDSTARRCALMRRARSFGRYGWRGGLADATVFDELIDPPGIAQVCNKYRPHAFMPVPAGSVMLNTDWTQQVIERFNANSGDLEFVVNQAPIGLSAGVFSLQFFNKILESHIHVGRVFGYDPLAARCDIVFEAINVKLPDAVINTPRRFLADSPRGYGLCLDIAEKVSDIDDGEEICRVANKMPPEPWPREVAIELTTRRPFSDSLRPVADRPDLDLQILERALAGLDEAGDINIMFDGLGDGLLHPQWERAVEIASSYGCVGLSTYLSDISGDLPRRLADSGLSVLQVNLDTRDDETYATMRDGGSATGIWANMQKLRDMAAERTEEFPFIVPFMLKTPRTLAENEDFYDQSRSLSGWSVLKEPSDYSGRIDFEGVFDMSPPTRTPCKRLSNSLAMTSDGAICVCEEDFYMTCAPLDAESFMDAWRGESLADLRLMHSQGRWSELELCRKCREFHRP